MLGSAIPKRLVFSLTLVGLVSLLMFSDAGLSFERASAQEGVGVTLTSVTSPQTSTYPAGTVVNVTTSVTDENGFVNGTLANDNYAWAATCGSVTASTTVPETTFTAPTSSCSGTISVNAYQDTATTSTVRDVDTITAAGTGAGDRTSAIGVASAAVTTTAIDMAGTTAANATALTVDSAVGIAVDEYVKVGSELMKVSARADAVTATTHTFGAVTTAMKAAELIGDTSIDIDDTTNLLVGEYIRIGDSGEIMKITAVTDGDTLGVTRGVLGTTATALEVDDVVREVTVGNAIDDAGNIDASQTDITVDSSATFTAGEYALIESEIVSIAAVPDGTSLTVVRGMFGTTAATHNNNIEVIEKSITTKPLLTVTRGVHGTTAATFVDNAALTEVTVGNAINDAGNIAANVTDITVDSSANFTAGDYALIGSEIIQITTVENGTSLNPVVRGMFGTTAAVHNDDAEVIEVTVTKPLLTVTRGVHGTTAATFVDNAALTEVTVGNAINNGAGITAAATDITVDSSANFAATNHAKIGTEIVLITAVPDGTSLTVARGQFGTTAATAANDAEVIEVTVTGTLAAGDTALAVADGSVFTANDYVEIGSEVLQISSIAANVLTVTRGQFGTTDAEHAVDATITKQVTASSSTTVEITVAAADPVPTYTDPSPVPAIVPDGLTADDVGIIIPTAGGSFTEVGGTASITVPAGAVANGTAAAVGIVSVATSGLPSPPAAATEGAASGTFTFGSSAINVQWYDATGAAQATYSLNKSAEICLPFTQDDLNGAAGGPDGLDVWRHNGTEWVSLNATANIGSGTVCGNASSFSSFALGLDVAAPGAASAGGGGEVSLPGTGGYSPAVTTLLLALMAGIVMVVVGSFTTRRVLWARDLS